MEQDSHEPSEPSKDALNESGAPPTLNYADSKTPSARNAMSLTVVATYSNLWEASLARGKLEAEGIMAVLDGENMAAGTGNTYAYAIGGIKVCVPAIDAERALALLPKTRRPRIIKCRECGSTDTRQVDFSPVKKVIFLLFLALPYLFVEHPWKCGKCGKVWQASSDDEEWDDEEAESTEEDEA